MAYISRKTRDKMPAKDFAGPHESFPIRPGHPKDAQNAERLKGKAANPAAVGRAITRIAKREGVKP